VELRPDKPWWRLRAEVCGPAVFESLEEINEHWRRVERVLQREKGRWGEREMRDEQGHA